MGWKYSRGVILSLDGTTPGESFCAGMERLLGSPSVLGWNDSQVVFSNGMEPLQGVLLSWNGTTQGESFCPGIERLQGSHSVLG